jgi:hypothetical protein
VHVELIPNPEETTEGVAVAVNVTAEPHETVWLGVLTVTVMEVITLPLGTFHVTGLVAVLLKNVRVGQTPFVAGVGNN